MTAMNTEIQAQNKLFAEMTQSLKRNKIACGFVSEKKEEDSLPA